jgi:hypothetical protein
MKKISSNRSGGRRYRRLNTEPIRQETRKLATGLILAGLIAFAFDQVIPFSTALAGTLGGIMLWVLSSLE